MIGNGFSILKIWQAYLVPIRKDGRHTLSLTKLRWQACLVPFVIDMASIPGRTRLVPIMTKMASILSPPLYKNCSQITSIANSNHFQIFDSRIPALFQLKLSYRSFASSTSKRQPRQQVYNQQNEDSSKFLNLSFVYYLS